MRAVATIAVYSKLTHAILHRFRDMAAQSRKSPFLACPDRIYQYIHRDNGVSIGSIRSLNIS